MSAALNAQPIIGLRPSLENHRLEDLRIDASYQRSIDHGASASLISKIAKRWDWRLFHPLAVSRRDDGTLWIVDGQHRHAAAILRGDIHDLPCVVTRFDTATDEAASFVAMNMQRRPLSSIDVFRASLAAADEEAVAVMDIIAAAGLSLATHSNYTAWKPRQIANIAGIRSMYRAVGKGPVSAALVAIATTYPDEVLRYAGTLFLGLARAYETLLPREVFDPDLFLDVIYGGSQREWYDAALAARADGAGNMQIAGRIAFVAAYEEAASDDDVAEAA